MCVCIAGVNGSYKNVVFAQRESANFGNIFARAYARGENKCTLACVCVSRDGKGARDGGKRMRRCASSGINRHANGFQILNDEKH